MRRFAILVTIYGACCASWATAAPTEGYAGRLQRYDQGSPASRDHATKAQYDAPRLRRSSQTKRVHYQEPAPEYHEEVTGQMVEGPMSSGPFADEWAGSAPWDHSHGEYCDSCYDGCYDCGGCGPMPGFWGRAEYLYWWVRGGNTPPLVTTSPNGTPQDQAGVLPDATVLFGDQRLNASGRSGARFTLGYWFNGCEPIGIDSSVFFLGKVNDQFFAESNGDPILGRPFFNVNTQAQDAQLIAFPGIVSGNIRVGSDSRAYGGDVNIRRVMFSDQWAQFQVLAGYRYFRLAESLNIHSNTVAEDPQGPVPVGTTFAISDAFDVRNNFNGGQLGVNAQMINGCWTLDLLAKLAIGSVSQTVTIDGSTTTTVPGGGAVTSQGGILALDSNIGSHHRNRFSVMPEIGADLRYQLTPLWRLNFGYTLMIVTNVVRPGDQVNLNIDPNQFPPNLGGTQPTFAFHDSDVWLQGINFGIECNF